MMARSGWGTRATRAPRPSIVEDLQEPSFECAESCVETGGWDLCKFVRDMAAAWKAMRAPHPRAPAARYAQILTVIASGHALRS